MLLVDQCTVSLNLHGPVLDVWPADRMPRAIGLVLVAVLAALLISPTTARSLSSHGR